MGEFLSGGCEIFDPHLVLEPVWIYLDHNKVGDTAVVASRRGRHLFAERQVHESLVVKRPRPVLASDDGRGPRRAVDDVEQMLHAHMVSRWTEIGDRVYVRRHASYDLNVGLVVGAERCAVIDTRASLREGTDLAEAVRQVTPAPWLVVNTHAHFDHYLGNSAFRAAAIWSSTRCADVIATTGEAQRDSLARSLRGEGRMREAEDTAASPILVPTNTFAGRTQVLDLGGRRVELTSLGRGHTDNDIVVTVAQTAVTFAGDLVEEGAPPSFEDSYPLDWPGTVEAMLALSQSGPFVPGHGAVVDRDFVGAQCAALAKVASVAREVAAAPPRDAWRLTGLPEHQGRIALARCLAQLRGELP